mgnify:CR=1 FL=1
MRISTKGTYALEIIVDLAMHSSEEHLEQLKNIAARRGLSEKYLERIVKAMKNENLILSTRGAMGGYRLARRTGRYYCFGRASLCGRRTCAGRVSDKRDRLWNCV